MHAEVGDKVVIHRRRWRRRGSRRRWSRPRAREDPGGGQFDDGHESLVHPGPDLTVVRSTA